MTILNGCARTVVEIRTVKIDSFCEGKYESLWLLESDFKNIDNMRLNKNYKATIDKYINHHTIHEKEYEFCSKENK